MKLIESTTISKVFQSFKKSSPLLSGLPIGYHNFLSNMEGLKYRFGVF